METIGSKPRITKVKMERTHPARSYAMSLRSEISDLSYQLKRLQTKSQIASFLIRHSEEEMQSLIQEVASSIRNFDRN